MCKLRITINSVVINKETYLLTR